MFTDYERETHDEMGMDVLKEKSHRGKGGTGNDPVIRMRWKSKSLWLLSIHHNLNRIGLNSRQPS